MPTPRKLAAAPPDVNNFGGSEYPNVRARRLPVSCTNVNLAAPDNNCCVSPKIHPPRPFIHPVAETENATVAQFSKPSDAVAKSLDRPERGQTRSCSTKAGIQSLRIESALFGGYDRVAWMISRRSQQVLCPNDSQPGRMKRSNKSSRRDCRACCCCRDCRGWRRHTPLNRSGSAATPRSSSIGQHSAGGDGYSSRAVLGKRKSRASCNALY
jgi:hypothetical protein